MVKDSCCQFSCRVHLEYFPFLDCFLPFLLINNSKYYTFNVLNIIQVSLYIYMRHFSVFIFFLKKIKKFTGQI